MPLPRFTNKRAILFLFACVGSGIAIQSCLGKKYHIPEYHAFLTSENFKKAERSAQIAQCASCHREIYENEQAGPHAAAYRTLTEHRDFVNSDKYRCNFYTIRVNRDFEDCVGCHAPENLPQTIFFDSLDNTSRVIEKILRNPVPPRRMGEGLRLSGIDCLSCHYDGNTILSLKHTLTAEDSDVSKQTPSLIMANNLNCLPCHSKIVRSFNPAMSIRETGSVMCISCHQEYIGGKGSHYYYWQHGDTNRKNPMLHKFIDDFHFETVDNQTGQISWLNTVIPHEISSGPEIIIECEVLDADSAVLGQKTIRTNNKKLFDEEMYQTMGNNYLFGTEGDTIPLNGKSVKYTFPVKNSSRIRYFKVSLYHKAQYWFPDTLKVFTESKTKEIKTASYQP